MIVESTEKAYPISIEEIRHYLSEGWLLYDVGTKETLEKHGIKYIALVNPNFLE